VDRRFFPWGKQGLRGVTVPLISEYRILQSRPYRTKTICCAWDRNADLETPPPPRQSVGGGKIIQKRQYWRSPLLKTTALEGKLTFGNPFLDSSVAPTGVPVSGRGGDCRERGGAAVPLARFDHPRAQHWHRQVTPKLRGQLPKDRVVKPTVLPTVGRRCLGGFLPNIRS